MEALSTPCNKVSCNSCATRVRSARRSSKRKLSFLVISKVHKRYKTNVRPAAPVTQIRGNHHRCHTGGQPWDVATAITPSVGSTCVVHGGWNPGFTSSAAYSNPG